MTDDVCDCGGQITKVTSNNRLLYAKTSQELADTNTEATYRKITYTSNARALFYVEYTYGLGAISMREYLSGGPADDVIVYQSMQAAPAGVAPQVKPGCPLQGAFKRTDEQ